MPLIDRTNRSLHGTPASCVRVNACATVRLPCRDNTRRELLCPNQQPHLPSTQTDCLALLCWGKARYIVSGNPSAASRQLAIQSGAPRCAALECGSLEQPEGVLGQKGKSDLARRSGS